MPCEYTVMNLWEKERQEKRSRQDEEERKRRETARKKEALLLALDELGFDDINASTVGDKTIITGKKGGK